jgi:hypothetical protein
MRMSAENVPAGGVRPVMTRRVLLAAGGLTLLAGCASAPAAASTDAAQVADPQPNRYTQLTYGL